jgi:hypothetical protein
VPIYPFSCPEHGETNIVGSFGSISGGNIPKCPECDKYMVRQWTPIPHVVDFRPGWQPAFGKNVDTKRERDNLVAEKGLVRG